MYASRGVEGNVIRVFEVLVGWMSGIWVKCWSTWWRCCGGALSNGWCMDYDGLPQIVGIMGLTVVLRVDGTGDWEQMAVIWAWLSRCIVTDLRHPVSFPRDGLFISDTESNPNPPATQPADGNHCFSLFALSVRHKCSSLSGVHKFLTCNSYVPYCILH